MKEKQEKPSIRVVRINIERTPLLLCEPHIGSDSFDERIFEKFQRDQSVLKANLILSGD